MKFKISSILSYQIKSDTTFFFNIQAAHTKTQKVLEEQLLTSAANVIPESFDRPAHNARILRVRVADPGYFEISYTATVEVNLRPVKFSNAVLESINDIDNEAAAYLFPSRYCQADRMYKFAESEFKNKNTTFEKVAAICNWIHKKVHYVSGSTNANTSALETLTQREGVCRDFAHLGIVLCRALSIPARYFATYASRLYPPDFHACFEAYIDGKWMLFDPTRLVPLNGLVKIAHGYDAADTSFANIYGDAASIGVEVMCAPLDEKAFDRQIPKMGLVSYA
ncbi:transglutaminase family protein [Niabella insulamsoli]|uniref:transglutaminase-like domain-containing protein n=1 Tax=Niabella insulamsoli TaxID=3144874 RepID=UPI0031FD1F93